jgi:hypothetical protein
LASCPACGEATELALDTSELRDAMTPPADISEHRTLSFDGWEIEFRLPNSLDLADALETSDSSSAHKRLIERCFLQATKNGKPASPNQAILNRVFAEMARLDPGAELELALTCPSCGNEWKSPFDIASFLWIELDAFAKRLLREVATLARSYGWRETDILALSPVRRQAYLDLM